MTDRAEIERLLVNGRTPEAIKRWISSRTTCNTCSKEHETGCEYGERTEDCQMCIDTLAYIERLEAQQPKWISVKERLPEEKESVLIHYVDGWMTKAFMLGGKGYQNSGETSWLSVTHWMPLPEPPEEEG